MFRKWVLSCVALIASVVAAAPAFAGPILYTITGNFTGTYFPNDTLGAPVAFQSYGTFVATADTDTNFGNWGGMATMFLDGVSLTTNLGTFDATVFALFAQPGTGSMSLFAVETPALDFGSILLQGYDLRTAIGITPVDWVSQSTEFRYGDGFLNISGAQNLTFSAQLGSAVPEPAGWAMMIVGFGLAGAALRRRGRTQARIALA